MLLKSTTFNCFIQLLQNGKALSYNKLKGRAVDCREHESVEAAKTERMKCSFGEWVEIQSPIPAK